MKTWTDESALAEVDRRIRGIDKLSGSAPHSAEHVEWLLATSKFLGEVFGEASTYYVNLRGISWYYRGDMVVHVQEVFSPGSTQARYDRPIFHRGLEMAKGVLRAAREELKSRGVEHVYEGKNTGPEASLILKAINLAETKLRKILRKPPTKEREIQDAYENLLIGADIPHSREKESVEYSSKTYTPDFTIPNADLAIELKLSTGPSHEKEFIAQINDDILAYGLKWGNLFFVVYDCGQIRDVDRFKASFESSEAVVVRVVKH